MNVKSSHFLTAAFLGLLALIILWADLGRLPAFIVRLYSFPKGDLLGHFLLMGVLSFLVNWSLAGKTVPIGRCNLLLGSVLVSVLVILEEFSQLNFNSRSFSSADLALDFAGIWLFGYLSTRLIRWRSMTAKH